MAMVLKAPEHESVSANDAVANVLVVFTIGIMVDGVSTYPGNTRGRKDSRAMTRLCLIRVVFRKAGANGRTQPAANLHLIIW